MGAGRSENQSVLFPCSVYSGNYIREVFFAHNRPLVSSFFLLLFITSEMEVRICHSKLYLSLKEGFFEAFWKKKMATRCPKDIQTLLFYSSQ